LTFDKVYGRASRGVSLSTDGLMHESSIHQHATVRGNQVRKLIDSLDVLPTTMHVPMRLLELRRANSASASDIAAVVSVDPALTSRVLALANSSFYAPTRVITRLGDAIAMIGLNNLFSFAFGVSLAGIFNNMGLPARELNGLRKASLLKSVAAREFALRFAPRLAEEAWLGGLLQDIAVPLMYSADQSMWQSLVTLLDSTTDARADQEAAMYGHDHQHFGGLVARKLGLPTLYEQVIAHHHQSVPLERATGAAGVGLARAIQFASVLPHRPGSVDPYRSAPRLRHWMPVTADRHHDELVLSELMFDISREYKTMLALVGDTEEDGSGVGFKHFLAELSAEVVRSFETTIGTCASDISRLDREVRQQSAA